VSERDTSKTGCVCGKKDGSQRVQHGLYVCVDHDDAFNDVNRAENSRLDTNNTESNSDSSGELSRIGAPAGWYSPESTSMACPVDSNRRHKCRLQNLLSQTPLGFLRLQAEEDANRVVDLLPAQWWS